MELVEKIRSVSILSERFIPKLLYRTKNVTVPVPILLEPSRFQIISLLHSTLVLDSWANDYLAQLSDDSSTNTLERCGGFALHWTSELDEHVTCVDDKTIRVFGHNSVIRSYSEWADDTERQDI